MSRFVASFITDHAGRVLLVRHRERAWELPGGHIEPGEKPIRAAVRECEEETGVTPCLDLRPRVVGDCEVYLGTPSNPRAIRCPLGAPGDLLFVGEEYAVEALGEDGDRVVWSADRAAMWREDGDIFYLSSDYEAEAWRPAVWMPKWAARTTLRNTGVRVERVGDVWTWIVSVETVMRDGKPVRPAELEQGR